MPKKNYSNFIKLFFQILILIFLVLSIIYFLFPNILLNLSLPSKIYSLAGERVFLITHNKQLSIKLLESAVEKNPKDQYSWYLLGRAYFVVNMMNKSESAFLKSIELDPDHEQSYYGLGLTYGYMPKEYYMQAAQNFQKYIEIANRKSSQGKSIPGRWAGYNDLAWIYFQSGDMEKCSQAALSGLKLVENPWLNNMTGICLMNEEKYSEAKLHLERALGGMQLVTPESFGQAYTGDDPRWYPTGRNSMEKTIKENLELINKKLLTEKKK